MRKEQVFYCLVFTVLFGLLIFIPDKYIFFSLMFWVGIATTSLLSMVLSGKSVSLDIKLPAHVGKKEEILLSISGRGRILGRVRLSLEIENSITKEKIVLSEAMDLGIRGKGSREIILQDRWAGCVAVKVKALKKEDLISLLAFNIAGESEGVTYIMPEYHRREVNKETFLSYDMESYLYSGERKGEDSSETFDLRSYRQGDSPKAIHWKLTGKLRELIVREYGLPVDDKLLIIWNNRIKNENLRDFKARDGVLEVLFSLSAALLETGLSHSAGWYDKGSKSFKIEEIKDEDSLISAVTDMMKSGCIESEISSVQRYIEGADDSRFAGYIYTTYNDRDDIDGLEEYGEVYIEEWKGNR